MTKLHLRRRANRRFTALGLALSMGLILGAGGIIRLTADDHEAAPAKSEEVAKPTEEHDQSVSPVVTPPDRAKGQREGGRLL